MSDPGTAVARLAVKAHGYEHGGGCLSVPTPCDLKMQKTDRHQAALAKLLAASRPTGHGRRTCWGLRVWVMPVTSRCTAWHQATLAKLLVASGWHQCLQGTVARHVGGLRVWVMPVT
jgi:hypothetical protein